MSVTLNARYCANAFIYPTLMTTQSCITTIPNFSFQMRKTDPRG